MRDFKFKKNVLVFPAGTEIALEIFNALKYSKFINLFGGTSVPCHAEFVFKNCIGGFPYIDDEKFIDYLNEVIEKYNIDLIYPAHDSVLMTLAENRDKIHSEIVATELKTVEICRSKNKTYKFLSKEAYVPKFYEGVNQVMEYPVFVKPTVGQGSNGAKLIKSKTQFESELDPNIEYAICEYLPGAEYTVDCFTDFKGELRVTKLRSRERIRSGIAVRSELLSIDDRIIKIAENINNHFKFNGAWFFQVKKNIHGEYKLLEISPRIPGTMGLSRNLGINFPLLTILNMYGYDIDIIDNQNQILLDRAFISRFKTDLEYNTIYLDFDDTIIVDENVNTQLISFLYQAINQNKKIILITKHINSIEESLKKYKISTDIFYKIIHLKQGEEKSEYITKKDAIFIDDSFAERARVKEICKIPVFDLDMVESLLDWRM